LKPTGGLLQAILAIAHAQTATVIAANEAAAHVGEYATIEGVVAKVFTSKNDNTFLNIGAAYPNQTFTGWIPPTSGQLSRSLNAFIVATLVFSWSLD
jgi:hypothetical protein